MHTYTYQSSVIESKVNFAKFIKCFFDHVLLIFFIGHIQLDRECASTQSSNFFDQLIKFISAASTNNDGSTTTGKFKGGFLAYAT